MQVGNFPHRALVHEILDIDGDSELSLDLVHDHGQAARTDGEILPDVHVGLDLVPFISGGIHDDLDDLFQVIHDSCLSLFG